ncbi:MAG TPA: tetratricopeptide repeat protein [Verrucomicrobiae bacterium]|nr:tetratricopeptide repeat protein [Verrucomicrobiae bacterium]
MMNPRQLNPNTPVRNPRKTGPGLKLALAYAWIALTFPGYGDIVDASKTPAIQGTNEVSSAAPTLDPAAKTNLTTENPLSAERMPSEQLSASELDQQCRKQLELARHYRHIRLPQQAEPVLVELLNSNGPEPLKQQAMLELAMATRDAGDLPRAQQIYAQYLSRWPGDMLVPEILLRQGQIFRDMGLNNLALAKFYSVMTSSLVLKNDKLEYYQRLVLSAQTEIAETHFKEGKYAEAADFFSRLLKQANPALDRINAQYRLICCLSALERNDETVANGQEFLTLYPDATVQPEVRFHLTLALKRMGRNGEALQQVLSLLKEQKERTKEHPELWAYWQQQAGNEIGNQLYREGDYVRALSVYLALAQLDPQPAWQMPVSYQIGLTYEHLAQPVKALENYQAILKHESELSTNAPPGTKALLEMARWRADFVQWQAKAETRTSMANIATPEVRK